VGKIKVYPGAAPGGGANAELTVTADYTPDASETGYRVKVYNDADELVLTVNAATTAYSAGLITMTIPAGTLAAGDYTAFILAVNGDGETAAAAGAPFTVTA
jgi:hypothetical protein